MLTQLVKGLKLETQQLSLRDGELMGSYSYDCSVAAKEP